MSLLSPQPGFMGWLKKPNHRVYTYHSKTPCIDIKNFMLGRMACLVKGYPQETHSGTISIDKDLWTQCQSTFTEMDKETHRIDAINWEEPGGQPSVFSVLTEIRNDNTKGNPQLNWFANTYKKTKKWKEEHRIATPDEDKEIEATRNQ